MTDPTPLLQHLEDVLKRWQVPPEQVRPAAIEIIISLAHVPIPTLDEITKLEQDIKVHRLMGKVPAAVIGRRLGIHRATVYRADQRARKFLRVA